MSRIHHLALALALGALFAAPAARAEDFGLSEFDVAFTDAEGHTVSQAGAHPDEMRVSLRFNEGAAEESVRDILTDQVAGFIGNPDAVPRCESVDFLTPVSVEGLQVAACPSSTALGTAGVDIASNVAGHEFIHAAVFNLRPSPGAAAKLGFWISGVPVALELGVRPDYPYNVSGGPTNISRVLEVLASELVLWGDPADPAHDPLRGRCLSPVTGESTGAECPAEIPRRAFLTLPRACAGPLSSTYLVRSWHGATEAGSALTHDEAGNPQGFSGCGKLSFAPGFAATPSSSSAESASGIRISLDVDDAGIANPDGVAAADIAATEFRFPAGMTASPSAAEGLGVCSMGQYEEASLTVAGCPEAAKIGTVEADTPVLENHTLKGSVYLAAQGDNPFGSLLAAYILIRDPELGVFARVATRIETDPASGRLVAYAEKLPPVPLERVRVELRSGPRAPLITPPACGTYTTTARLFPSSGGEPATIGSDFEIDSGPGGGPCPAGDLPFDPGFQAGTESNAAGSYSPFDMRLTREDGEQDITRFDATLPPGVLARLAGVQQCPDAAIEAAKAKSGRAELAAPSCPAGSQVGQVVAGAGVGSALTYASGSLYLAGAYGGDPLSVVAIVPAVAGPFDVGTVVVRQALALDPVSGRAQVDSAASDPIPHILAGIPLKVRDIQVRVDRSRFTLNPTSCRELASAASIWGGGQDFLSALDDSPVARDSRFQAASCASLAFKPRLAIRLYGGAGRGALPALRAVVRPRAGQANFARAAVTLPKTAFLEQAHLDNICTRVQFAAGEGHGTRCPRGSVYGHAKAWSPLLDGPAQGPVYLRSSSHKLPDLVVALKGPDSAPVQVELSSRIDSVRLGPEAAGIRSVFTGIPDVPVSRFVLSMRGGSKGLIVNSDDLCRRPKGNRARAGLRGQNGRRYNTRPVVVAVKCAKQRKKAKRARAGHRRAG